MPSMGGSGEYGGDDPTGGYSGGYDGGAGGQSGGAIDFGSYSPAVQAAVDSYLGGTSYGDALGKTLGLGTDAARDSNQRDEAWGKVWSSVLKAAWSGLLTVGSVLAGNIPGIAANSGLAKMAGFQNAPDGFKQHFSEVMDSIKDLNSLTDKQAKAAIADGFQAKGYSKDAATSIADSAFSAMSKDYGGSSGVDILTQAKKATGSIAGTVGLKGTGTSTSGTTKAQTKFSTYEDALKYAVGQSALRADEAWAQYKEFVMPYEQAFYTEAEKLVAPSMALTKKAIKDASKQLTASRPVALKFWEEAATGVDPTQRADQAQAEVEHAYQGAEDIARRSASRMGIDFGGGQFQGTLRGIALGRAADTAGARTQATTNAETENFNRLTTAMGVRQGINTNGNSFLPVGVSNPASTATTNTGQSATGAQAGMGNQLGAIQVAQNKPYEPSFGDMLVNSALSGLSSTDWSKAFKF